MKKKIAVKNEIFEMIFLHYCSIEYLISVFPAGAKGRKTRSESGFVRRSANCGK